ncbi:hypothetical protein AAMO2058_001214900 [Amorphochlora amoebiformis]
MQASNVNPLATHEFSFSLTVAEEYAFDTKTKFVFKLLQVKQRLRPIRNVKDSPEYKTRAFLSWKQAKESWETCSVPVAPPKKKRDAPKDQRTNTASRKCLGLQVKMLQLRCHRILIQIRSILII